MSSSKFDNYELNKKTKYFFSFNNEDGEAGQTPSNFTIMMNNGFFTNLQSYGKPSTVLFNPLLITADLKYFNVSETLKNNKFRVESTMFTAGQIDVVIPTATYTLTSLATAIQTALNAQVLYAGAPPTAVGWLCAVNGGNTLKISYTNVFGGATANTKILFNFPFPYDTKSLLGFSNDNYTIAYANRATGITGEMSPDLLPYSNIRLCSNLAKRFWVKRNAILTQSDILIELPITEYQIGAVLKHESVDTLYEQEINSDFNSITFQLKDDSDRIIEMDATAVVNIIFSITREITYPSPEEKLRAIQNYATYTA